MLFVSEVDGLTLATKTALLAQQNRSFVLEWYPVLPTPTTSNNPPTSAARRQRHTDLNENPL